MLIHSQMELDTSWTWIQVQQTQIHHIYISTEQIKQKLKTIPFIISIKKWKYLGISVY